MRRIRLTLSYDGTAYAGWQRQKNGLAVQQVVEECLERATGVPVRTFLALLAAVAQED